MRGPRAWRVVAPLIALPALALVIAGCGDGQTPIAETPPPAPAASKKPAAVGKTPKPKPASAGQAKRTASGETDTIPLTVRNGTTTPVTLKVIKTANYDWTSPRPDWPRDPTPERPWEKGGFQGTTLKPWEEDTRDLGTNVNASGPFGSGVYFEMEFIINGDTNPPVVRLQEKTGCCMGNQNFSGWGSSDTSDETCDAVTKSFPDDKIKVTMECNLPDDRSLVKIERL